MGTNYYAIAAPCSAPCRHCRPDEIHIGKSLRMFEAHDDTPWGRPILSWSDWKEVLHKHPEIEIQDEYGSIHEHADFIADVEAVPRDLRRRQYEAVRDQYPDIYAQGRDYLDADGYSWTRGEFS